MKKQKPLSFLTVICLIFTAGFGLMIFFLMLGEAKNTLYTNLSNSISLVNQPPPEINNPRLTDVTIYDLIKNPQRYIRQHIKTEGTLKFEGKNYYTASGKFYLIDSSNNKIAIEGWQPLEVAPCSPGVLCKRPETMQSYLDKRLSIQGVLYEKDSMQYINNRWLKVGVYYEIMEVQSAKVIN